MVSVRLLSLPRLKAKDRERAGEKEGGRVAIFAETLVEEWLNRNGYFTVRGAKAGLLEMDLLGCGRAPWRAEMG